MLGIGSFLRKGEGSMKSNKGVRVRLSPITAMFLFHDYIMQYGWPKSQKKGSLARKAGDAQNKKIGFKKGAVHST